MSLHLNVTDFYSLCFMKPFVILSRPPFQLSYSRPAFTSSALRDQKSSKCVQLHGRNFSKNAKKVTVSQS